MAQAGGPYRVMANHPPLPADLCASLGEVETATIGHFEHLGFVSGNVRPAFPAKAVGKAVTVAALGRDGSVIYRAIDLLEPGDVMVISRVDHDDIACVGGGVATAVKARRRCYRCRWALYRSRRDYIHSPAGLVPRRIGQDQQPSASDRRFDQLADLVWRGGCVAGIRGPCG